MRDWIAVALGGMLGSVARYAVSIALLRTSTGVHWPLATWLVNTVGCFAIGLVAGAAQRWGWANSPADLALRVGFLGGFTTFSAFGLEVVRLTQSDRLATALSVVLANVVCAILAAALGEALVKA